MSGGPDDDLQERIEDLEQSIRAIQEDLEDQAPRGPFGLPRPPSPSEFLRFADEAAIPAAIAILETNIKLLEALRRVIRLMEAGERHRAEGATAAGDMENLASQTVSKLDTVIADLEQVVEGTPPDVAGRDILEEAEALREEIRARVADADVDRPLTDDGVDSPEEEATTIDVDAELESIKRQQGKTDDADADPSSDGSDNDESE